jgi:PI-3-kinase-related kinase SMG-1
LSLCKQLQEGITVPENQKYIKRNLDIICESLLDLLYSGPSLEAKHHIAKCLGRIGYIADQDFKRLIFERKRNMNFLF